MHIVCFFVEFVLRSLKYSYVLLCEFPLLFLVNVFTILWLIYWNFVFQHIYGLYTESSADSTTKSMLFLFVTLLFFSSFFSDATIHFFFVFFTLGALNLYFFGILSFIGSFDIYMCIVWIFHMYKMNTHWFLSILRVLSYVVVVCWFSFRRLEPLDISF